MKGHTSVVTKIVALPIERCFSLDAGGEIRYWDISMNDIDNRFVSSKLRAEDRFHSFDVFTGLSTLFDAVNNIAVAALGRLTHMYKLVDTSPVEDPPVAILFSYELLTIVTVHPRDLFLWNVVSGELIQRIHNIGGASSSDVTSATLNTKGQKIFCGHSSGSLSIYNAYNGYHMHTVLIAPSAPIRFMSYSPEKVLFILCGNADLYALDDGDEFCSESILRVNRIADRFIVSLSYSNALGVVALADSQDVLMFFDMEFFTLELTINQVTGGSKIGQVTFLGDYPLLLVCGNNGTFVIVPIDLTKLRIPVWRVTPSTDELKPFIDSRENAMLSKDRVNAFLKTRNNVKSIGAFIYHGPVYEDEESVYKIAIRKSLASMNSFETEIKKIVHLTQPQEQIDNVKVVVGYESGACGIFDFSRALRSIGMPKLKPADFACTRDSFDPRRRVEKATTEFSLERTSMLKTSVRRNEKRAACYCDCIWQAHVGPVVSVMLMRHNKHILTASEDRNVKFWSIESQLKGTLTRGTKTDKVMALGWTSPIDAAARQQEKQELALILKKKLGLRLAKFNAHDRKSKKMSIISNVFHGINPLQSSIGGSSLVSPSISSTAIYQLPDRIRTIGQLHGGITYKQSTKDFHRSIVGSPRTQLANSISKLEAKITQKAPLKRQKKKKNQETIVINSTVEDTEYLESVLESTKLYESDTIGSTKTRYDAEIQVRT
jgi:WD40 repeat protein